MDCFIACESQCAACSPDGKVPNENLELWDGKQGDEWTGQV
jgi:hypothetical protein